MPMLDIKETEVKVTEETVTYTLTNAKKPSSHERSWIPAHLPRIEKVIAPNFDTNGYVKK